MALRADRPTRLVCIEMHDAAVRLSPLLSLCGPSVAAAGRFMAVGAELRLGQPWLTAKATSPVSYQYSIVTSADAALLLQNFSLPLFGSVIALFF